MIGKQILHYHITEKLGSGGMGVVFKAHDSRLNRSVALKFLPPRFSKNENVRKRFLQEAQAASALDHPNICNIHNFYQTRSGQMFICMAYYEGRSLKVVLQEGGLSLDDILSFSVQLARGLARGHEAGITHRDIKPANLIITPRGELKIVDFGLAKLSGRARLTRAGIVLGTPGYMSPEQALGRTVDHRTDIWSLGVVMFEMLVGHLPFSGKDDAAMLQSILTKSPRSLEHLKAPLEVELRKIIEKTLAKNPRHRYQSMAEVLADLILLLERKPDNSPREAQSGDDVRTSIVVLPFKDVSPEHDQEYFCDGLTEELINSLSRIKELKVVSRTSAFQFKGREADIREIGSILNVHTILEGSIRKAGNKVRITAQLVNVADGFHLWSEQFERELKDVFAIQDSIARAIADTLALRLSGNYQTRDMRQHSYNVEAYNIYLKGRYYWNKRTVDEIKKGMHYFKKAIEKDPSYPLTYAGLADTYLMLSVYGAFAPRLVIPKAIRAARKALALDEKLVEARISLACAEAVYERRWDSAEQHFQRGIGMDSRYATGHHWYAINMLTPTGRFEEALEEMRIALQLDPISLVVNTSMGLVNYFARRYDAAIEHYRETLELDGNFGIAQFFLGQAYLQKGQYQRAITHLEKALRSSGDSMNILAAFGHAAAISGREDVGLKVLNKLRKAAETRYVSAYDIATVSLGLGLREEALEWLDRAVSERAYLAIYLAVDPVMSELQEDHRFNALLKRMSLTAPEAAYAAVGA